MCLCCMERPSIFQNDVLSGSSLSCIFLAQGGNLGMEHYVDGRKRKFFIQKAELFPSHKLKVPPSPSWLRHWLSCVPLVQGRNLRKNVMMEERDGSLLSDVSKSLKSAAVLRLVLLYQEAIEQVL